MLQKDLEEFERINTIFEEQATEIASELYKLQYGLTKYDRMENISASIWQDKVEVTWWDHDDEHFINFPKEYLLNSDWKNIEQEKVDDEKQKRELKKRAEESARRLQQEVNERRLYESLKDKYDAK